MTNLRGWIVLAGLMFVLGASVPVYAADGRPIAMSEVKRLLDQDQSPQQVLAAMVDRGVGFRVTKTATRRLEQWGFTESQIDLVRRIAAGEDVDLDGKPDTDKPVDPQANDQAEHPVGYPNPESWHQAERKRIERAIKNSVAYKRIELTRCTLYCSEKRAKQLVPMLRKLEADLIQRFPESLSNASSPKSAHIVIIDGTSEWRNWVGACFDSYEQDGIKYRFGPEDDPRPQLIAGGGYMLPACTATHADKHPNDEAIARYAAYSLGHLMMGQAAGPGQPDGLQTGFGDYTEALAHRTPSVMVYSYEKRDLGADDAWKRMALKQFTDKKIKSANDPWELDTTTMKPEHYAMAWSMVSTLAEAPDKFAQAVAAVHKKEKQMGEAVADTYGLSDRKLLEAWYRFVSQ